ncbi:hypothetical protein [Pseudomonas gingeri]|uniref:hypothetical protein n=1 Tax=Pseudomonas gingeri TaxID=117681 RepID=UPI0015A3657B|nr:hypothetical protein [Pseudomonas gingeri]NWA11953.1 hypothetical protein [Pseudomonas gingeri]
MLKRKGLVLGMLCMMAVAVVGCSVLKSTAQVAYTVGSTAVTDYCALPASTRAIGQLVLVGKVYNSGVCDVIAGDVDLQQQLATATAAQINALITARVEKELAAGNIDQATADIILASGATYSAALVQAITTTTTATKTEKAAAIVTEAADVTLIVPTTTPTATAEPEVVTPAVDAKAA